MKNTATKTKADTTQLFVEGKLSVSQAQSKLGKSRATVYRYAKMISEGKDLTDRRKFGNNRKYGKGQPA